MADRSSSFIVEFTPLGASVKVTAVDPETGIEASIIGPANAMQQVLTNNAIRKLKYVLEKKGK